MARVSVIIPAYNAEAFVANAIDTVLGQTYADIECIVVDDGSTDGTREVVARYGERVRYVHQANAGPSAARNRGIDAARGDLIGFLDADDAFFPEKVARQAAILDQCPDADAAICDCLVTTHEGEPLYRLFQDHPLVYRIRRSPARGGFLLETSAFEHLLADAFIYTGSLLLRREALERVGEYDTTLGEADIARDVQFHLRVAYHCRLAVVDEPLYEVRVLRPGSVTSHRADLMRATLAMYDSLPSVLPDLSAHLRRRIRERRRLWALNTGIRACYGRDDPTMARWLLGQAARTRMDPQTAYYLALAHVPVKALELARRLKGRLVG